MYVQMLLLLSLIQIVLKVGTKVMTIINEFSFVYAAMTFEWIMNPCSDAYVSMSKKDFKSNLLHIAQDPDGREVSLHSWELIIGIYRKGDDCPTWWIDENEDYCCAHKSSLFC
jgi:hypothetical protein